MDPGVGQIWIWRRGMLLQVAPLIESFTTFTTMTETETKQTPNVQARVPNGDTDIFCSTSQAWSKFLMFGLGRCKQIPLGNYPKMFLVLSNEITNFPILNFIVRRERGILENCRKIERTWDVPGNSLENPARQTIHSLLQEIMKNERGRTRNENRRSRRRHRSELRRTRPNSVRTKPNLDFIALSPKSASSVRSIETAWFSDQLIKDVWFEGERLDVSWPAEYLLSSLSRRFGILFHSWRIGKLLHFK